LLRSLVKSALLHAAAVVLIWAGLPHLAEETPAGERIIVVEMVEIAPQRNLPNAMTEPAPVPETPPAPAEPETEVAELTPPPPRPAPPEPPAPEPEPNAEQAPPPPVA